MKKLRIKDAEQCVAKANAAYKLLWSVFIRTEDIKWLNLAAKVQEGVEDIYNKNISKNE